MIGGPRNETGKLYKMPTVNLYKCTKCKKNKAQLAARFSTQICDDCKKEGEKVSDLPAFQLDELIDKLIGPTEPQGESHLDTKRLENLKAIIELADHLMVKVAEVALMKNQPQYSIKEAGELAEKTIHQWEKYLWMMRDQANNPKQYE